MVGTKNYFDKIVANQNQLMATFQAYTNQAVEAMVPDKALAEKGAELINEFVARPIELADEMTKRENLEKFQKDFWGAYSEHMAKSFELSAQLYGKTFEYMKETLAKFNAVEQQERMRKLNEAAQNLAKTYTKTTEANAKVVKEFMTV